MPSSQCMQAERMQVRRRDTGQRSAGCADVRSFLSDESRHAVVKRSFHTGDRVRYYDGVTSFRVLIDDLYEAYRYGHTAPLAAFRRYLVSSEDSQPRTLRAHGIMRGPLRDEHAGTSTV